MEIVILLLVLIAIIALDIAALRWGYDSTEAIDSSEWQKRLDRSFRGREHL